MINILVDKMFKSGTPEEFFDYSGSDVPSLKKLRKEMLNRGFNLVQHLKDGQDDKAEGIDGKDIYSFKGVKYSLTVRKNKWLEFEELCN